MAKGTRFVPVEQATTGRLSDRTREVLALMLCGFCLYAMLCLATLHKADFDGTIPIGHGLNLGGRFGYYLAGGFTFVLGNAAWVPFLALLAYAIVLFLGRAVERMLLKVLGTLIFAAMVSLLLADPDIDPVGTTSTVRIGSSPVAGAAADSVRAPVVVERYPGHTARTWTGPGGAFGANLSPRLQRVFGGPGRLLLLAFGALVSLLLVTEWMFSRLLVRLANLLLTAWRQLRGLPLTAAAAGGGTIALDGDEDDGAASGSRRKKRRAKAPAAADDDDEGDEEAADQNENAAPARGGRKRSTRRAAASDAEPDDVDEVDGADAAADGDEDAADAPSTGGRSRRRGQGAAADKHAAPDREDEGDDVAAAKAPADAAATPTPATPPAAASPPPAEPPVVIVPPPKAKLIPRPKPKPRPKRPAQTDLPFDEAYPYPPVELFREPETTDVGATSDQLQKGGDSIVSKLGSFGIQAEVVAASVGPAVTQFELRLAEGIRVNRIVGFEADLAAALKAVAVRVVAPIPGKDTIGIEVPNPERQKVPMRDLLDQFGRAEDLAIPLFLGKDVAGNPIVEDLARMPHLLIAGTTGSGKSVCINAILLSILMTRTPQQVKLILVDPKMVELQAYKRVPHLCCDVVTNMKKAPSVLQWAVDEMENRYAILSAAGVNHIRNYNRLGQQELEKRLKREVEPDRVHLPYIVIVIDEFADLMNVAANEVEESIQRLAQKSRAVGMHVIVATQRPSSEVITGIIKANLPCQIAFKVNRRIDSRVILDSNGAEKLLGHGDMLYVPPGGGIMLRAQGAFVADEEMQAVVRFLEEQGQQPNFLPALMQTQTGSRQGMADKDALYREAVEVILGQQRGSATLLQRALSVGYTRATRLLEMMEEDGLVGPFVGSKSREVFMTLDEWKAREIAIADELDALAEAGEGEGEGGSGDGDGEGGGDGALAMADGAEPAGEDAVDDAEAEER